MPPSCTASRQALEVIIRSPGTMLEDIVFQCPDLTWNQLFLAIDRLRRDGTLTLTPKGQGLYAIQISDQASLNTPSLVGAPS